MQRGSVVHWVIAGSTALLMAVTAVILVLRKERGFGSEFFVTPLIALLPSAIFAIGGPVHRRFVVWSSVHIVLMASLAPLYLISTAQLGFLYAFVLYFAALSTQSSLWSTADVVPFADFPRVRYSGSQPTISADLDILPIPGGLICVTGAVSQFPAVEADYDKGGETRTEFQLPQNDGGFSPLRLPDRDLEPCLSREMA